MGAFNPKLDIVFKMLFADEGNRRSLIALLNDALQPSVPILDAIVLNPEIARHASLDKGPVLDLRVRLADGRQVHVEMQRSRHPSFVARGLYYWARVHGAQLERGQDYAELRPSIGVFILDFAELPGEGFHSVFQLLERHAHFALTDHLELHYVELPKVEAAGAAQEADPMLKWARFLAAETDAELEQLAMTYPELRESKETLERLRQDRLAKELAELREHDLATVDGDLRRASAKSLAEGLRRSIETVCQVLGRDVDEDLRTRMQGASSEELEQILREVTEQGVK